MSSERIFKYHDGERDVYGDPLQIQRRLTEALDGEPDALLQKAGDPDPAVWAPATEKLITAVRAVFCMRPFDRSTGQGATEQQCRNALDAFLGWMEKNALPPGSTPTSPPSTAPPASTCATNGG